jgi:hypothetical protein
MSRFVMLGTIIKLSSKMILERNLMNPNTFLFVGGLVLTILGCTELLLVIRKALKKYFIN